MASIPLTSWTVDTGGGPQPCTVPHAWQQNVDLRWEGPAVYRTEIDVPAEGGWLVFEGVSYQAKVYLDDELALVHEGIWDAFSVPLGSYSGQRIGVRVEVVKNGGESFPVKDVASGFLPFVFHTFGGIWRSVYLVDEEPNLEPRAPPCRIRAEGTKLFVDEAPFYLKGVLTWGWYPETGHPNPVVDDIRAEVGKVRDLGFNTVKFCLWVPSHEYFEILEEFEMFAWVELPLWDPSPEPAAQEVMFQEIERIVRQYRRHGNILAWTCGCELSSNTSAAFRKRLYDMVKELTGAALVKDNSGSSEMYGGDLREYGDFYDFHPYCDTPSYPAVLDSLLVGPREKKPILLGEFNDIDAHRDLARIKQVAPYWSSDDPRIADQGVRWEKPALPRILRESRWVSSPSRKSFETDSVGKANFMRRKVQEAVRSREDIAGYVITGIRDTPISTSGVFDDWGEPRDSDAIGDWNSERMLFPIPSRRPPWVNGGNRPGWLDPWCIFEGDFFLQIGGHFETATQGVLEWTLEQNAGVVATGAGEPSRLEANRPTMIATAFAGDVGSGEYLFRGTFAGAVLTHPIRVVAKLDFASLEGWRLSDPGGAFFGAAFPGGRSVVSAGDLGAAASALEEGGRAVLILLSEGTRNMPFWRESAYEFPHPDAEETLLQDWSCLMSISGDRVIDLADLEQILPGMDEIETFMLRVDTRTYAEHPILIRARAGSGVLVATTLRPFGGLGAQPNGLLNNPAGVELLRFLIGLTEDATF